MAGSENDKLVWIDCEMTGLDLAVDELVEIAVVVTDFELRVLDPGFQVVIKPSQTALANMNDFVTSMHESSGLLDELPAGVSLAPRHRAERVIPAQSLQQLPNSQHRHTSTQNRQ